MLLNVVSAVFIIWISTGDVHGQQVLLSSTDTNVVNDGFVPVLCACAWAIPFLYNCTVVLAAADPSTETSYTPHRFSAIEDVPDGSTLQPFLYDTLLRGSAAFAAASTFML